MGSDDLRRAREGQGLDLDEISVRTRIPRHFLEALERGDEAAFPRGPFWSGYMKQYRGFLGLPEGGARTAAPATQGAEDAPPILPVQRARGAGRGTPRRGGGPLALRAALLGGLGLAAFLALSRLGEHALSGVAEEPGTAPDQVLSVGCAEPVRARVEVDGREVFAGTLQPGPARVFRGHDRIELELDRLDGVRIAHNGRALEPLGAQGRPRRLVFIDDSE